MNSCFNNDYFFSSNTIANARCGEIQYQIQQNSYGGCIWLGQVGTRTITSSPVARRQENASFPKESLTHPSLGVIVHFAALLEESLCLAWALVGLFYCWEVWWFVSGLNV